MNFLELMGVDPETVSWQDFALCARTDTPNWFFEEYEKSANVAKQVDQMCLSCPVMKQCAEYAMENDQLGVWGGIYWNGSGKPDTNKNSHKTEEIWKRIRERLADSAE